MTPTKRKPWPYGAESKRQEAQELADENTRLAREAETCSRQGNITEARMLIAQIQANNERIARLMAEAKQL